MGTSSFPSANHQRPLSQFSVSPQDRCSVVQYSKTSRAVLCRPLFGSFRRLRHAVPDGQVGPPTCRPILCQDVPCRCSDDFSIQSTRPTSSSTPVVPNALISAVSERFYIVDTDPSETEDRVVLRDGSAVICVTEDKPAALAAIAGKKRLRLRWHSSLSRDDQQKMLRAGRS
jgi:hypothetical protein